MNIIDIVVILLLLSGLVIGFKRGFVKQSVIFIGKIATVVIAFILKTPVAMFLYKIFPFLKFNGLSALNIILYEIIAFILIFIIVSLLFRLLSFIATWIEKLFRATIILGIPSKILGALVGLFEMYLVVFILLLIFISPVFNIKIIHKSYSKDYIINKTPVLSNGSKKLIEMFNDIWELRNSPEKEELDEKIYNILEENKFITEENIDKLINSGKIVVEKNEEEVE